MANGRGAPFEQLLLTTHPLTIHHSHRAAMTDPALTNDFPPATEAEWRKRVEGVLKGADFSRKLVGRTHDGIEIQPLYAKAEAGQPVVRSEPGAWRVSQRVDHPDPATANELALADLSGGADALTLVARKAPASRGFGVAIATLDDLDRALADVMLDLVHLRLDAGGHGRQIAALLIALVDRRGHALSGLSVDLGLDPLGAMAAMGKLSASWDEVAGRMGETQAGLSERGFAGRIFLSDGRPYHEAGASEAQELAAVLATGIAYLRALEAGGISLDAARNALAFLLVADADEFLTVAKFRALRRLWARVEQASGLDARPIRLHAETAWRMTTRRDPWVNLLRTTVATFSAGLGGADAITILPFTTALGLPDAFARRIARNTHLILLEEANLARVADPASGAGGFEALTEALCEKAWALFQATERDGGIVESLKRGTVQRDIAGTQAQREKAIATRKEPITGTSEFPNLHEGDVSVLMPSPLWSEPTRTGEAESVAASSRPVAPSTFSSLVDRAAEGAELSDLAHSAMGPAPVAIAPLPSLRAAEPFERLRDASDAVLARTGARPKVFLATLGNAAAFTARAGFAKNFFEAGGIEAAMAGSGDMVPAYRASGAALICLCSSDEIYQTEGVAAIAALRRDSAAPIYVAGRPAELETSLTDAGATGFIYAGCDAILVLREAFGRA